MCEKLTGMHILPFALFFLCGFAIWDYEETNMKHYLLRMAEERKKELTIVMDVEAIDIAQTCLALVMLHDTNKLVFSYVTIFRLNTIPKTFTLSQSLYPRKMMGTD